MIELHHNAVNTRVLRLPVDALGRPGPFVCIIREMEDGDIIRYWYTPATALWLADELRRAATA